MDNIIENTETINKSHELKVFDFPHITKFEKTRVIGIRASQINNGSNALIDTSKIIDPTSINIAEEEFIQNKLFFLIKRSYSKTNFNIYKTTNLIK